ncbi:hypothetical protein ACJMK2_016324 [Sinanodonta woodiana]|uniref:U3 small nucleolar RNA-interacting protein 2 n=1 Tax=Sinanodonta woodiana TaxID=1069815 RepID=A0ABD3UVC3_SINWO
MSFFIKNKKRKQDGKIETNKGKKRGLRKFGGETAVVKKRRSKFDDEEIVSDSDLENGEEVDVKQTEYSSEEEDLETPQEKKLRLAKQYLAQIETEESEKWDKEEESHKDVISQRLKHDLLEQTGRLQKEVADNYVQPSDEDILILRGHHLAITCLVISHDDRFIFTGSKDCSIIKWDMKEKKRVHTIHGGRKGTENKHIGHTAHVLCLAVSCDGQYLVSGDRNKLIHLWDANTCQYLHTFRGHRDAVSGLAFRKGTHQLFSASHDRTVKIWNVDEKAYIETLYGHQDCVTGIDSLTRDRAITSGGRDGSVRIWKVVEESQLVFHGHVGSVDCVALINESNFLSGADDNSIAVWSVLKKKPLVLVRNAHGESENPSLEENWISAVASLQHTDLIASGSKDGFIKLWKTGSNFKSLKPVMKIPVNGFVNCLQFSKDGSFLVAGVGQEHRLGRWWKLKDAKNSLVIIQLKQKPQV